MGVRTIKFCLVKRVLPVLFTLFLVFAVSCSNEAGDRLVSVNFDVEQDDSSRSLVSSVADIVAPEDCFWTYTAVKTEGYYTTGASEKNSSGKLIEKRVSDVKGLSGVSRKFSQGKWTFNIFGYADKDCTQLIYTAEKSNVSFTSASQTVLFTLKNSTESGLTFTTTDLASDADKAFSEKGLLELEHLVLFVPEGVTLRVDSSVLVEIFEGTNKIASSCTTVVNNVVGGGGLYLSPFEIVAGKEQFTAGTHTFTVKATYNQSPYYDESVVPMIGTGSVRVPFVSNCVTNVSGSLSGLTWSGERSLVGGQIYYVGPDNGAKYRFFDYLGYELTNFTVEGLRTAYSYTVEGLTDSAPDRFYVFNKDAVFTSIYLQNRLGSSINYRCIPEKGLGLGDGTLLSLTSRNFGSGRENTEHIRSSSNYSTVCNVAPWTTGSSANKSVTVFNILEQWNAGDGVIYGGSLKNTTGVYDWYVPSLDELETLMTYFGQKGWNSLNSGATFFCYSSTVKITEDSYLVPDCAYVSFANSYTLREQIVTGDTSSAAAAGWWYGSRGCVIIRSF